MKTLLRRFLCASLVFSVFAVGAPEGLDSEAKQDNQRVAPVSYPDVPPAYKSYPADVPREDRIMGAIMGVLIGDALGVGCHWYYSLECKEKDFGWVTDYVDPKLDSTCHYWVDIAAQRVKAGLKKGGPSQTGQLFIMLLESVAEKGIYDQNDFTTRVDKFFKTLDGTPFSGRYTDSAMRGTWKNRHDGVGWDDPKVGSDRITSEAAQMNAILAGLYSKDAEQVAKQAYRNTKLFYHSDFTLTHSVSYALVVSSLINGVPLGEMIKYIRSLDRETLAQYIIYNDSRHQVETGGIVWDPEITFEPPHLISKVYGMHCEIQQLLPAAYYFIHRFPDDFEKAVLSAVNGGGNNMARAALTGGMSGAMVGLKGIPERFIKGLKDHERLLKLAENVAESAVK